MKPLIKICGITNKEDALFAAGLDVWALGFVFAESPRKVSVRTANAIAGELPPYVSRVGVFVDDDAGRIRDIVKSCRLDIVQLHGNENPAFCADLRKFIKVIKAFRIKDEASLKRIHEYDVDLYLLDTYSEERPGGTGRPFNWGLAVKAKRVKKKIVLAGGLNPLNIAEAVRVVRPYAVDISSGIEDSPGRKNRDLMKKLVLEIKGVDNVT